MVEFIQVEGDYYDMGIQQGEQLPIKPMIKEILHSEIFQEVKPKLVPTFIVKFVLGLLGRFNTKKAIKKHVPNQFEKMKGIAKGGDFGMNFQYGVHFIEVYTGNPKSTSYIPQGCTKLFAKPPSTADDSIMYGRNYDFPQALRSYQMVRLSKPDNGLKNICLTQYPLAGTHMGMNEDGLVVGINYARTWEKYPDDFSFKGVPPTLICQEVIENFSTTEEAIKFITDFPARSNAQHYGILDKSGDACVIETTHSDFAIRRPEDGILAHTNTYRTKKMWDHNVPDDHHWKMKSMRDISYVKSPKMRYERASELLNKYKGKITMETFKKIFSDHNYPSNHDEDNKGVPDDYTVCTHGDVGVTLASIISKPKTGKFFVTDTQPCKMDYEEFSL
ncbi:MAG: linear amide C-N hydrolase [Candidatus Lokiarchaeota archaeon]|nr:linear amide C-N hydrolase [Candidatus Lokiarchaeota archaeon]